MGHALALGARGLGQCWPRPSVGCVLVRDGRVIARGRTDEHAHAEAHALAQAGDAARGATAYVSLEPCAHHGRTPPCAEALVAAGVARVVTAIEDPDPRVAGQGHAILRAAGIALRTGVQQAEARRAHAGFLSRVQRGRPWLTLKLASSFDGRIATASGESRWITGPEARRLVHAERARHDAVLVGAGTARADDPLLTVRGLGVRHQPVRIVASRRLDLPLECRLADTAEEAPLWLAHGPDAEPGLVAEWHGMGAKCLTVERGSDGQLSLAGLLRVLGDAGLTRVFCEGGGMLSAALLSAGLVDELVGFTAGLALGAEGQPALGPLGLGALAEAPRFRLIESRAVAGDVLHRWQAT